MEAMSHMQNIAMQAGFVVAVIGGGSAFIGLLYAMYKAAKRIEAAIGVDSEGKTLSERMEKVEYQLWENGGKSLKDKVNKNDDVMLDFDQLKNKVENKV